MSLETKVGRAVLDMGDIIKTNVIGEIAKSRKLGSFSVTDAELTTIANIISSSIDSSIMNASDMIIKLVTKNK